MQRVYFPGLNAIRFYAAFSVIFGHLDEASRSGNVPVFEHLFKPLERLFLPGNHAVTLFFVLSGFLITYLLLAEHERTGTVAVGKFYLRRLLRIWPVYYLTALAAFIGLPLLFGGVYILHVSAYPWKLDDPQFWLKFGLVLVMLPNLRFALFPGRAPADHLWSIGVEEQFYLMWPLLVRRFRRHLFWVMYAIILIKIVALAYIAYNFKLTGWNLSSPWLVQYRFILNFRLEAMAIGGLAALAVYNNTAWILRLVYSWPVKLITVAFLIANITFWQYDFSAYEFTAFEMLAAVFYCLFILNVAANPRPLLRLENGVFTFLGNISYSLYMYHPLVLSVVVYSLGRIGLDGIAQPLPYNLALYGLVIGLSLALSTLSYYTFERFFLRLKDRFTVVRSGAPRRDEAEPAADPEPLPALAPAASPTD